ncbi:RNA polymerase II subunit A C-terminal domain phosphatase SSU72-like protein [Kickxella alabastrina]|uniref:RNA polymerase II subunit A C-terminal domain phosphatase n=1 Tax=Kickxella alabastrina TaxID=61397 RepID=A0ACC1IVQ5_9FUNG|nr:RNA polymerase II subunit A C-terminal domain phosphatase SSU72-like protein [Kickxella alabastrina]KAI7824963.1 RNA polymerase II subunit A C-terminal domain phosphatase SSU72-like protein [Kickxella alabastrina]KAJ1901613.1 RNA polymerase II subunit A C-terminal domain phosphatase [Kickxella alabastrina]KAJ1946047.1 RNA polymerase II subunit A C-terminal domain phosphatase [Kickxella alabastrina]
MVKFAVVCASNMNRSMEAHYQLKKQDYNIQSFGTGQTLRLPGPSPTQPNTYPFGMPYTEIREHLRSQNNIEVYTRLGLFSMLERNVKVKAAPQRFQLEESSYDVIFTCEERVFDSVCEELLNRAGVKSQPVHVINVQIEDNNRDAIIGAKTIVELARMIVAARDLERDIDGIIEDVQNRMPHRLYYMLAFY